MLGKRIIASILTTFMILSVLPAEGVFAADVDLDIPVLIETEDPDQADLIALEEDVDGELPSYDQMEEDMLTSRDEDSLTADGDPSEVQCQVLVEFGWYCNHPWKSRW